MIPLLSNVSWVKLGAAAVVIIIAFLSLYVVYQNAKIETLTVKLETSELNNKKLNNTIRDQNAAIIASNEKHEQVQTQLHEANGLNKALVKEFKNIKNELKTKPVPRTCDEALHEMVGVGKTLGNKWKK